MISMFLFFFKFIIFLIPPLVCVAFYTLLERKVLSLVGIRQGPNKVSFLGLLQPLGDALKLSNKSLNSLSGFSVFFYYGSSTMMLSLSILFFSSLSSSPSYFFFTYPFLLILMVLSLNSFNSILCGWSAFSKFSLIGSVRTVAQLISYEAVLFLCFLFFFCLFNSFSLDCFSFYPLDFCFLCLFPCFLLWIPVILAELNRTPYDFSEGESELVSGFNTEFSSGSFTLIFLAEYSSMVFFSMITSLIFFSSVSFTFLLFFFFFLWIRSVLPRFRFDKLMSLSWKLFIPFLTVIFIIFLLFFF